ncbi:MAG TPA: hypothetical protein VER78_05475 [Thermoanaerobaculia bacterium]|nr:hypothetical protein [Thermoanaerobaculia bacterium]
MKLNPPPAMGQLSHPGDNSTGREDRVPGSAIGSRLTSFDLPIP